MRNIKGFHGARISSLSWNRSVLAPYLITTGGKDSLIINHDIRVKNPVINYMSHHKGEICNLQWSTNHSHTMMQTSDPSNVYLASASSSDFAMGVWRLSDLCYSPSTESPWYFEREFDNYTKALAWSPNHEGLLATGGGIGD